MTSDEKRGKQYQQTMHEDVNTLENQLYDVNPEETKNPKQCQAKTRDGRRCRRVKSKLYPYFCTGHGQQVYQLYVAKSEIPDSGLGLFALTNFDTGDFISLYTGDVLLPHEYKAKYPNARESYYCLEISKEATGMDYPVMVDAKDGGWSLSRFINDTHGTSLEPNVEFSYTKGPSGLLIPIVRAIKPIERGDELLIHYGDLSYWNDEQ